MFCENLVNLSFLLENKQFKAGYILVSYVILIRDWLICDLNVLKLTFQEGGGVCCMISHHPFVCTTSHNKNKQIDSSQSHARSM